MTKAKKYCLNNEAIANHHTYYVQIHYINDEFVYLSELVRLNAFGKTGFKFHRCKIQYYADGTPYIRVHSIHWDGKRQSKCFLLDDFCRIGDWYWYRRPHFSCAELSACSV